MEICVKILNNLKIKFLNDLKGINPNLYKLN